MRARRWHARWRTSRAMLHTSPLNRPRRHMKTPAMNSAQLLSAISSQWDDEIVTQLTEYIRIPAKSPDFDPKWESNGHIERAIPPPARPPPTQPPPPPPLQPPPPPA